MDSCFKPDNHEAQDSLSPSKSKNGAATPSNWFDTTRALQSPENTNRRDDTNDNTIDYQRTLGICMKLIAGSTVVAAVSLIVFMSRTNLWAESQARSIFVAIIAILFTSFFIVQSAKREHNTNWMIGSFGVVDRLGDRVTSAGISACGTLMFICALLFVSLPKKDGGFQNGELAAFIFGICCVVLTILFAVVMHIVLSRTEVEVDSTAFISE